MKSLKKFEDPLLVEKFTTPGKISWVDRLIILEVVHSVPTGGKKREVLANSHASLLRMINRSCQLKFLSIIPFPEVHRGGRIPNIASSLHTMIAFTDLRNPLN